MVARTVGAIARLGWRVTAARCPLCDGIDLAVFVERMGVPVHQNVALATAAEARSMTRGDLRLACCASCGFVTNLAFRKELVQYGEGYENDQTNSAAFETHMGTLVDDLLASGIRNKLVVEVGCGQGQFLRRLCAAGDNRGMGFDPAYVGPDTLDDGRVSFVREFYSGQTAVRVPDLVVCRHVIEHVPAPLDLLENVRAALGRERDAQLAFETPAVDWILEGTVIQDFFYEHCSYFTAKSLQFAFERAGFTRFTPRTVFGGQYLWARAEHRPAVAIETPRPAAGGLDVAVQQYGKREKQRTAQLERRLRELASSGPVAVWGAGAKGVTFLNLMDPGCELVDVAVDINPRKQNRFIAGTGHPIVEPREIPRRDVKNVVVMNPNYVAEVGRLLSELGAIATIHAESDL
jgi:SAM-dependent methyltransferase